MDQQRSSSLTPTNLNIKGGSIRTKLEYVRTHFGEDSEKRLAALLRKERAWPILEANWYSFELFDRVLRFIADSFLDGDLSRLSEIGRHSAHQALTGVYGNLTRANFEDFLQRRLPILHNRYYSSGKLEVPKVTERGAQLCLTTPQIQESDLHVAMGFYCGAAEFMGRKDVTCKYEIKGKRVVFLLLWTPMGAEG